jgi:hypothetical protein
MKRQWMIAVMAVVFFATGAAIAGDAGSIRGTVVDPRGKPVSQAKVTASSAGEGQSLERFTQTDVHGEFVLENLPWGKYIVTAEKPEAGYPDSGSAFYGGGAPNEIMLGDKATSAPVAIKLQSKTSIVTGTVADDVSSQPVMATFLLRRVDDPTKWITIAQPPTFRVLVPSDTEVTMEVSAPAYKVWYYPGTGDAAKKTHLRVRKGQELKLKIRLQRDVLNCACLDRPTRWGLGPDSPDFQIHGSDGLAVETLRCNKESARMMPRDAQPMHASTDLP